MYVIVVGGGKVGYYLSKHLLDRGYEVTLIEKDSRRAELLNATLGEIVMVGDGDEMAFLATTGMERADVVVAVTGDDEDNLVTCQLVFFFSSRRRHTRFDCDWSSDVCSSD